MSLKVNEIMESLLSTLPKNTKLKSRVLPDSSGFELKLTGDKGSTGLILRMEELSNSNNTVDSLASTLSRNLLEKYNKL